MPDAFVVARNTGRFAQYIGASQKSGCILLVINGSLVKFAKF
jgi:hypothetical protein